MNGINAPGAASRYPFPKFNKQTDTIRHKFRGGLRLVMGGSCFGPGCSCCWILDAIEVASAGLITWFGSSADLPALVICATRSRRPPSHSFLRALSTFSITGGSKVDIIFFSNFPPNF